MSVIDNAAIQQFSLPGLAHQTLASHKDGLRNCEVWMQMLGPGAETPVHYHDCEEVIVVMNGSGQLSINDEVLEFGPHSTLIIPPDMVHQLVNSGTEEITLIATFSSTSAKVFTPDGEELVLPWQS